MFTMNEAFELYLGCCYLNMWMQYLSISEQKDLDPKESREIRNKKSIEMVARDVHDKDLYRPLDAEGLLKKIFNPDDDLK